MIRIAASLALCAAIALPMSVRAQESTDAAIRERALAAEIERDDPSFPDRAGAAERVVVAMQALLDSAVERGDIVLRTTPPPASRHERTRSIRIPPLVGALIAARGRYLGIPGTAPATRLAYDVANAEALYHYGHFEWARERYWRLYRAHCHAAPDVSELAWTRLYEIAMSDDDRDRAVELQRDWERSRCVDPEIGRERVWESLERAYPCVDHRRGDTSRTTDLRVLFDTAERAREAGEPSQALYETVARELASALERTLERPAECHTVLPRTALLIGRALRHAHLPVAAAQWSERALQILVPIVEAGRIEALDAEHITAIALFEAGVDHRAASDYDAALASWRRLTDDETLAASSDPEIPELRANAAAESVRLIEAMAENHASDRATSVGTVPLTLTE